MLMIPFLYMDFSCFIKTPLTDKNDFPMPYIISSEDAARIIVKAIAKKKSECHFPKKLTTLFKFISVLPKNIQMKLIKRKFA